jgi:hypothetical protein
VNLQNLRPWPKGVSGNPTGSSKAQHTLRELARTHTKDAVNTLVHLMKSAPKPADRIEAASILLSRGWGLPTQPIAAEGELMIPASVLEDARTLFEDRMRRLVEAHAGDGQGRPGERPYASREEFLAPPPPALPPAHVTLDAKLARLFDETPDNGGPAT